MANYPVPSSPSFSDSVRKFEKTDRVHADVINETVGALFDNEVALNEKKANKVASATNGNFASLNASGDLQDSGKKVSDFANATHSHTVSQITDFPSTMTPSAHTHTKSEITDFPTSMTPTAHNQAASTITAGTLAGKVNANATAAATVTTAQVRDIYAGTSALTANSSALTTGTIYVMYE